MHERRRIAELGLQHALPQGCSEAGQLRDCPSRLHSHVHILLLRGCDPVGFQANSRQQGDPDIVSMAGALEGEAGDAHEQGLAGGGGACVGEGVQADVHEGVGCQVVRRGRHEWKKVNTLSRHPASQPWLALQQCCCPSAIHNAATHSALENSNSI